ncbi:hypothetical protein A3K72_01760 [Candidatus Woesearchaeota archaeon RBG_13_36_6]|nr:MAG: hypothetical protein A3K72_01760 [Candidatus Woesearchaeota archaeon RBG_13_36_6]
MRKSTIIVLGIILLSFIIATYVYPQMPDKIASHWNAQGQVDGYMSKFLGLFLMPLISLGLFLLFVLIPEIDPLKQNVQKFRRYYDLFIILFITFLFYLYLLTIFWNLNFRFNMIQMLLPSFGILFYYIGILTENTKRNWFIGIKTPWTLSNDKVWYKTHKLGGKLFKITGIIAFLGILFQKYAILFVLVPAIFVTFYVYVYSYLEYQKQVKK